MSNDNMNLFSFCLQHTSFSPDGKLVVTGGFSNRKVWHVLFVYIIGSWLYISLRTLLNGMRVGGGCAKCEKLWMSNFNFDCLCRLSHLFVDTWISHLHLHGILMATYLLLGTKTKHVVFGMFGTCQNPLLFLKATLELYAQYVSHLMDSSWRWSSQLTLCMCTTQSMDLRRSKRLIFLGRSLVYPLALIHNHSLLVFGIAPTEAFYSSIDAEK